MIFVSVNDALKMFPLTVAYDFCLLMLLRLTLPKLNDLFNFSLANTFRT